MSLSLYHIKEEFYSEAVLPKNKNEFSNLARIYGFTVKEKTVESLADLSGAIASYYAEYVNIKDGFRNTISKVKAQMPHLFPQIKKVYYCCEHARNISFLYEFCFRLGTKKDQEILPIPKEELDSFFFDSQKVVAPETLEKILKFAVCVSFKNQNFEALIFYLFLTVGRLLEVYKELNYRENSFINWANVLQFAYDLVINYEEDQYIDYKSALDSLNAKIDAFNGVFSQLLASDV